MNHLRLYEEFSERLYHSIDVQEYDNFFSKDVITFDDNHIQIIKKITDGFHLFADSSKLLVCLRRESKPETHIYMNRIDDEYYLVKVIVRYFEVGSFIRRFYLCDQFDGLISFLEDMKSDNFSFVNFI